MLVWPVLLRLLLSLGLILSGSGLVVPTAMSGMGHASMAHAAPAQSAGDGAAAEPVCHEATSGLAPSNDAAEHSTRPVQQDVEQPGGECCETSDCSACAPTASAVIAALRALDVAPGGDPGPRAGAVDRDSPASPHLIRPPIA